MKLGWRDGRAVVTTGSMTLAPELPNDVEALKRLILEEREQRQAAIDEAVKAAVAAILRRYYGPRSESFDPRQLLLFGQQVIDAAQCIGQQIGLVRRAGAAHA